MSTEQKLVKGETYYLTPGAGWPVDGDLGALKKDITERHKGATITITGNCSEFDDDIKGMVVYDNGTKEAYPGGFTVSYWDFTPVFCRASKCLT